MCSNPTEILILTGNILIPAEKIILPLKFFFYDVLDISGNHFSKNKNIEFLGKGLCEGIHDVLVTTLKRVKNVILALT